MVDQDFCLDLFDLDGTSISNGIPRNGFLEASKQNKFGLIKQFIDEMEAVVDITDHFSGNTALHEAAIEGHHKIVRLLLENRVQVSRRNYEDFTALDIAIIKGNYSCVVLLIQGGADVNPMHLSFSRSKLPLHQAAECGHMEIVKLLIWNGAIPERKDLNKKTALHYAVKSHSKDANEICEILLKKGVDVDAQDKKVKNTALNLALKERNEEVIQTILNFGANAELRDEEFGTTPLETAIFLANSKAVKILVENGLCPLRTRHLYHNSLEISMMLYECHNKEKGQEVVKTMVYAMSKN